jgi:membrane-associated phospholipid phosphatase
MFLLNSWLHGLLDWDRSFFRTINQDWSNSFFDALMPFMRNSLHWAPLYLFVIGLVLLNFRSRGLWWLAFFLCTVALTDMTGTYLIKHELERLRPCRDPLMVDQVRLLVKNCSAGYSFISNHAANHFGMAVFFIITFRHIIGRWVWLVLLWAPLIGYAQVYVGVHYPLDVIGGALVGTIFGIYTGVTFNKRFGFTIFEHQLPA